MDNKHCFNYFAASNSSEGFVNYFPQVFSRENCSRVYIIKGGPGTGKSRFMRDVAKEAESRGLAVKYYYCSSDADSLDGIIIDKMRVGLLDGTAPHVCEPTLVGAFEQIINLGDFWDEQLLAHGTDEIETLVTKKSQAYKRAYMLLAAYGKLLEAEDSILAPCINKKKLSGAVKRWLHKLPESAEPTENIGLCRAVGMNGYTKFDTYEEDASMLFTVSDSYHASYYFMNELRARAKCRNMSVAFSCDPIMPSRIDALCICDAGITFVVGADGEHKINIKRFINENELKPHKEKLKKLEASVKNLELLISESFEEVKKYHFQLEKIYMTAMDFGKKEQYTENFIKKLFK